MDLTQQTGRRLRDLRLQRNHTLAAVAGDLAISPSALSAYELDQRPITLALLERFAEYYGRPPDELLGGRTAPAVAGASEPRSLEMRPDAPRARVIGRDTAASELQRRTEGFTS